MDQSVKTVVTRHEVPFVCPGFKNRHNRAVRWSGSRPVIPLSISLYVIKGPFLAAVGLC